MQKAEIHFGHHATLQSLHRRKPTRQSLRTAKLGESSTFICWEREARFENTSATALAAFSRAA